MYCFICTPFLQTQVASQQPKSPPTTTARGVGLKGKRKDPQHRGAGSETLPLLESAVSPGSLSSSPGPSSPTSPLNLSTDHTYSPPSSPAKMSPGSVQFVTNTGPAVPSSSSSKNENSNPAGAIPKSPKSPPHHKVKNKPIPVANVNMAVTTTTAATNISSKPDEGTNSNIPKVNKQDKKNTNKMAAISMEMERNTVNGPNTSATLSTVFSATTAVTTITTTTTSLVSVSATDANSFTNASSQQLSLGNKMLTTEPPTPTKQAKPLSVELPIIGKPITKFTLQKQVSSQEDSADLIQLDTEPTPNDPNGNLNQADKEVKGQRLTPGDPSLVSGAEFLCFSWYRVFNFLFSYTFVFFSVCVFTVNSLAAVC